MQTSNFERQTCFDPLVTHQRINERVELGFRLTRLRATRTTLFIYCAGDNGPTAPTRPLGTTRNTGVNLTFQNVLQIPKDHLRPACAIRRPIPIDEDEALI